MITIYPDTLFCDQVDGIMITAFRKDDSYLIIQRENSNVKEFHIELNDQQHGCYNGIEEIIINNDKIIFQLNTEGKNSLNTDVIEIDNIKFIPEYETTINELKLIKKSIKG